MNLRLELIKFTASRLFKRKPTLLLCDDGTHTHLMCSAGTEAKGRLVEMMPKMMEDDDCEALRYIALESAKNI